MASFEKLDDFFDNKNTTKTKNTSAFIKRAKKLRLIKILLPAIAASLVGLLLVIPNIKKSTDTYFLSIKRPSKADIDKVYMENTIFYFTDKNNMVNNFTAELIDEMPNKQDVLKLTNPRGFLPSSKTNATIITSPIGYYNEKTKILSLNDDATINCNNKMTAKTKEMFYDTKTSKAYSVEKVDAVGDYGDIKSNGFEYYKRKEVLSFLDSVVANFDKELQNTTLTADKRLDIYIKQNKAVAIGNATAIKENNKITANSLTMYFSEQKDKDGKQKTQIDKIIANQNVVAHNQDTKALGEVMEYYLNKNYVILKGAPATIKNNQGSISATNNITYYIDQDKAIATGDVVVDNGTNKIYSNKMEVYFTKDKNNQQTIKQIEIPDSVKIITKNGEVTSKTGIYYPQTNIVKLYEDVVIIEGENILKGNMAETNIKTGQSKIISGDGAKVSGVLFEED